MTQDNREKQERTIQDVLKEINDNLELIIKTQKEMTHEYSCAATPQIRQTGNRLSGLAETAYASLLAQCFV